MNSKESVVPKKQKPEAGRDRAEPGPAVPEESKDRPLFHGHPEGNVEKLIEHGRQMGF